MLTFGEHFFSLRVLPCPPKGVHFLLRKKTLKLVGFVESCIKKLGGMWKILKQKLNIRK